MIARTLHQIELTSRCNLQCVYCLQPTLTRRKQDMARETFDAAMVWLAHFVAAGTQGEVVLTGTGESTLHPDLVEMIRAVRTTVGPTRRIALTTNGLAVTDAHVEAFQRSGVRVYVSLHRPEKAESAAHRLQEAGVLESCVMDPVVGANSWAGQVAWPDRIIVAGTEKPVCPWLSRGWLFCASDGTFYDCCYANGDAPARGTVFEQPHNVTPQPWHVCGACWQRPPSFNEISPELIR